MPTINHLKPEARFLEDFRELMRSSRNDGQHDLRQSAFQHFERLGFPSLKNEEWKYTNMLPVISEELRPASKELTIQSLSDLNLDFISKEAFVIILQNGYLNKDISALNNLPTGLRIKNISDCASDPIFNIHFAKYADSNVDAFAALNTSFYNEGVFIHVEKDCKIDQPIYIINYTTAGEESVITYPRCLVVAGKHAKASIEWITISPERMRGTAFINAVNEIVVEENAFINFCILQNDQESVSQVCNTYAVQEKDSHFNINTITTGGNKVRNKLHITLDGVNTETHLFGLAMGSGTQLIDNHTAVMHAKPHCFSNQIYKTILDGSSQGVFNGKIFVMKDAQKTNAYQSSKNILLSDEASMFAKPQLEIFADDVKCSHGATTGQIDAEALFYLRTRGIGIERAKALLNLAFAADVINNIPNELLRNHIMALVENKLYIQNN